MKTFKRVLTGKPNQGSTTPNQEFSTRAGGFSPAPLSSTADVLERMEVEPDNVRSSVQTVAAKYDLMAGISPRLGPSHDIIGDQGFTSTMARDSIRLPPISMGTRIASHPKKETFLINKTLGMVPTDESNGEENTHKARLLSLLKHQSNTELVMMAQKPPDPAFQDLHKYMRFHLFSNGFILSPFKHFVNWQANSTRYSEVLNDPRLINIDTEEGGEPKDTDRRIPVYIPGLIAALSDQCQSTIAYEFVFDVYSTFKSYVCAELQGEFGDRVLERSIENHSKTAYATYILVYQASRHMKMSTVKFHKIRAWMECLMDDLDATKNEVFEDMMKEHMRVALDPKAMIRTKKTTNVDSDDDYLD